MDYSDVDRSFFKLQSFEILSVLLRGDKRLCARSLGGLPNLADVALRVAIVIGKVPLPAKGKPPIPEIARKSGWIPDAAKSKKRTRTDFRPCSEREFAAEAAESEQSRGRGENRIRLELLDRFIGAGDGLGPSKYEKVRAAHGGERFPEAAGWQQSFTAKRMRCIHQEDVEIAGQLQVLETVIEKKDVDRLL